MTSSKVLWRSLSLLVVLACAGGCRSRGYTLSVRNRTNSGIYDVGIWYGSRPYTFGILRPSRNKMGTFYRGGGIWPVFDPIPSSARVIWKDKNGTPYKSVVGIPKSRRADLVVFTIKNDSVEGKVGHSFVDDKGRRRIKIGSETKAGKVEVDTSGEDWSSIPGMEVDLEKLNNEWDRSKR